MTAASAERKTFEGLRYRVVSFHDSSMLQDMNWIRLRLQRQRMSYSIEEGLSGDLRACDACRVRREAFYDRPTLGELHDKGLLLCDEGGTSSPKTHRTRASARADAFRDVRQFHSGGHDHSTVGCRNPIEFAPVATSA